MVPAGDITELLERAETGDPAAVEQLAPLVYEELRALASRFLWRERADHTLQTTALVHEAYLRLVDQTRVNWKNRAHFLSVAATMMRRVLVNHARDRGRLKRGGDLNRVSLEGVVTVSEKEDPDLLALDAALTRLAELDPQKVRLVELRYFAGCSVEETAEIMKKSPATVKREWSLTKAWLLRELGSGEAS